ncbi:superoxide dismutase [Brevundimonas sp. MYb46]|nr:MULTISPECIES: superoxide dismutase family protein [unclassified Brevundimonas]PRA24027.1 superoxide dismutase [Brevundimonas sp. MYb27]PQZ82875.1 superoxide dismutase [Brevundimonas sp. MYb31]PRB16729.1 superoxide dismutase [Brevundimonas sp. MYb52]PRB34734.1 superoxide dismutase [Brevundimonas sp. MYb46]PRB54698.1 superoxide dismutase [Brevundimonas sp. MYb33]
MRLTAATLTAVAAASLIAASASAQSHDHAAMGHGAHAQAAAVDHSAMIPRATPGQTGQASIINGQGAEIGTATLTQGATGLLIKVEAAGLTPGWHGIHIHATGQCAAPFTSAGAHINHTDPKTPHGLLNAQGPDDGDLPNLYAAADGSAHGEFFTTKARISQDGPGQWLWDADGSALVIHANPDDHNSQPIGGAGDRVACAVLSAR